MEIIVSQSMKRATRTSMIVRDARHSRGQTDVMNDRRITIRAETSPQWASFESDR